jgi:hypothetical protein
MDNPKSRVITYAEEMKKLMKLKIFAGFVDIVIMKYELDEYTDSEAMHALADVSEIYRRRRREFKQ